MVTPRRYRISISREGWCYLVVIAFIFLGAVIRDINLLVLLFGMLIGPLLYSWIAVVLSLRGVQVTRQLPTEIVAGEPFEVQLTLTNGKRRFNSWAVCVDDRIEPVVAPDGIQAIGGGVLFFRTPAGQSSQGSYLACLTTRGQYRFGPLVVASRFPFGLVRRSMVFDDRTTVTVLPRLGQMAPGWSQPKPGMTQHSRISQRRRGMLEGEFLGLREWRSGDSTRWIHWRTTARKGELMVRQFERHQNHDLALLLDLWQPADPTSEDRDRVELAVSLVATMLREHCRQSGGHLWLFTSGRELPLVKGPASMALFRDGMEGLAVQQALSRDHMPELVAVAGRELPLSARIRLITTRKPPVEPCQSAVPGSTEDQLAEIWSRIETIDVSSGDLDRCFQTV